MYEIEMNEISEAFFPCWKAAGIHLSKQVDGGIQSWLRAHPYPPFLEHLSFRLGNQLFFVRVDDVDGKVQGPGNPRGAITAARSANGRACILPMTKKLFGGGWVADMPGWGLLDAVVCADGRPGNPFYTLKKSVAFIDINEEPIRTYLDSEAQNIDLSSEIEQIIGRAPDEMLQVADSAKEQRESVQSWAEFNSATRNNHYCRDKTVEKMVGEVSGWLEKYGNNVKRWRVLLGKTKPFQLVPFMISCIQQVYLANRNVGCSLILSNHNNPLRDYFGQDEWCDLGVDRLLRFYAVSSSKKSVFLLDEYLDYMPPVCRKKSIVIPNPISKAEKEVIYNGRDKLLLAVGRFTEIKNFSLLVDVVRKLPNIYDDWKLEIYGEGPEKNFLQEKIIELGLEGRIILKAPTKNISAVYSKASIFLSASKVEGFPLTLCEALAHGLPVVGRSTCSGVNSLVENNFNGVLVDTTDPEKEVSNYLAELESLLGNFDKRLKMSSNAVQSMTSYEPKIIYDMWKSVLGLNTSSN